MKSHKWHAHGACNFGVPSHDAATFQDIAYDIIQLLRNISLIQINNIGRITAQFNSMVVLILNVQNKEVVVLSMVIPHLFHTETRSESRCPTFIFLSQRVNYITRTCSPPSPPTRRHFPARDSIKLITRERVQLATRNGSPERAHAA